jgi:hypothetical protein
MQTRRRILQQMLPVSVAVCLHAKPASGPVEIFAEPNCLSQESAGGFRSVLASGPGHSGDLIVLCGMSSMRRDEAIRLRARVLSGSLVVYESSPFASPQQRDVLREVFHIEMSEPVSVSADHLYVCYLRPWPALSRRFSMPLSVMCDEREVIATYRGVPVAMKRLMGRGSVVYLGAMLGPNLLAGEREARGIVRGILNRK